MGIPDSFSGDDLDEEINEAAYELLCDIRSKADVNPSFASVKAWLATVAWKPESGGVDWSEFHKVTDAYLEFHKITPLAESPSAWAGGWIAARPVGRGYCCICEYSPIWLILYNLLYLALWIKSQHTQESMRTH